MEEKRLQLGSKMHEVMEGRFKKVYGSQTLETDLTRMLVPVGSRQRCDYRWDSGHLSIAPDFCFSPERDLFWRHQDCVENLDVLKEREV